MGGGGASRHRQRETERGTLEWEGLSRDGGKGIGEMKL